MAITLPETLREKLVRDIKIRGLSPATLCSYMFHITDFAKYHQSSTPEKLGLEEVHAFLLHMKEGRHASKSYSNTAASALRFFFKTTVGNDFPIDRIPYQQKPKFLPQVLSQGEIKKLIKNVQSATHRLMFATIYSAGLRLSELLNLRVKDVDGDRKVLFIRQAKGQKDRYVHLAPVIHEGFRRYFKRCKVKPTDLLFPGKAPDKPLTRATLDKAFREGKTRAGIQKSVCVHTLRHSFATHLLEGGASIVTVQHLLGHSSLRSTMIYLHVAKPVAEVIQSPIDKIWPGQCKKKA